MGEGPNRAKAASKDAALVCYNSVMNFAAAIARLKEHETELKQLSVQHLYLFGSTAGGRPARIPMSTGTLITRTLVFNRTSSQANRAATPLLPPRARSPWRTASPAAHARRPRE